MTLGTGMDFKKKKNYTKTSTSKRSSSSKKKSSDLRHSEGKKCTFSTTIYIYEDRPKYYLHGNRLQYVHSQDK